MRITNDGRARSAGPGASAGDARPFRRQRARCLSPRPPAGRWPARSAKGTARHQGFSLSRGRRPRDAMATPERVALEACEP